MRRHSGSLGWFDDESNPTVSAQLFIDYAQKERAFDLTPGRAATRAIVGAFFDGASFYRTTGIWKRKQSGGLSVLLYFTPSNPKDNTPAKRKKFIERARSCAKFLQSTFYQEAVGMLTTQDGGAHRVEFVGDWSTTTPINELLTSGQLKAAADARVSVRGKRLDSPDVWGD